MDMARADMASPRPGGPMRCHSTHPPDTRAACAAAAPTHQVYGSGGFYGMSAPLLRAVAACYWAQANTVGHEDLQSGRMAQMCAPGGGARFVHIENGVAWCHSKRRTLDNIRLGAFPEGCGAAHNIWSHMD